LFLFVEWQKRGKDESDKVTWPIALWMGVAQLIAACFPGVSRSGCLHNFGFMDGTDSAPSY